MDSKHCYEPAGNIVTGDLKIITDSRVQSILCNIKGLNTDFFQRQLSIIKFTLNYPPIRYNLTSASLLSMLIETDYLN